VNGILFNGYSGSLYGYVTITEDLEIPQYYTLTIPAGKTLKIPEGKTLTVTGTVTNNGTIIKCGTIIGAIGNNQPVECNEETFTLTFNVFNAETTDPVLNAVITLNGEVLDGYEAEVEEGDYEYTVSHPDYETYSGSQFVDKTMTIDVPLTPKPNKETYILTFNVFDANTTDPVLDAVITLNGEVLDGYEAEVEEGDYEYTVSHPDYETYSGTQFVDETMTIEIPLTPKVGIADITINDVVLYPNPFTNEIYVGNPSVVKSVVITDAAGQTVKTATFDGKTISTKELASGIYFITLEFHDGRKIVDKMIKK
jgi:hypothetical protein